MNYGICLFVTLVSIVAVYSFPPIAQDPAYHQFADQITMLGIPNFWNVMSNLPFLWVGGIGFGLLGRFTGFVKYLLMVLMGGIVLTGLGSGWYHLSPSNKSLVWDRLPMTIVFMSFFTLMIYDCINKKFAKMIFIPLLAIGIFSVLYWKHTESAGVGDLRLYGLVQFYPMLMIPLIMWLFQGSRFKPKDLVMIVLFYVIAKLFEHFDHSVFRALGFMSGHAIKHVFAAGATWFIVKGLKRNVEPTGSTK